MRRKRFWLSLASALVTVGITAGVVIASWSASGSGTGVGAALSAQALTAPAPTIGSNGASLYPGGPAGKVFIQITNPNPYNVVVRGVTWGAPVSQSLSACPSSNVVVDAGAPTSIGSPTIPANSTSSNIQVLGVLDMASSAPDSCQGVTFDVPVTLTGAQS